MLMKQYVREILHRFQMINKERLARAKSTLRPNQRDFIEMIPLLFHINDPALPGFVSTDTPCGIANMQTDRQGLAAARRLLKIGNIRLVMRHNFDIQSVFIMGSSGTLAHSTKSDFDCWLCHQADLSPAQLHELRAKCVLIERWAEQLGLEVHFFLMDAKAFRTGKMVDLSSESSGSAQHHLLLDEFYRTGLLLDGRYPAWWLVPPEQEKHYDEWLQKLQDDRQVYESDYIDFGGMGVLPAEEFFGAGVWQIYKGVDSPYKSVLKILLMEVYSAEYPATTLLCLEYKQAVYDGEHSLELLDPYIMLVNRLTAYLVSRGQWDRLDLVRRCFYFKVGLPLSRMKSNQENWQYTTLHEMVKSWKWNRIHLANLDGRSHWKIDRVAEERRVLVEELTQSYFTLSRFARDHPGLAISQHDLNILGRKLYAAFERKAGKIELVNRGIATDLHEPMVILQQTVQQGRENWFLFRAHDGKDELSSEKPLKRTSSLLELLSWAYFNGVIDRRTVFSLRLQTSSLSDRELHAVINVLHKAFPDGEAPEVGSEALRQPARLERAIFFANIGRKALAATERYAQSGGDYSDILNYGLQQECLLHGIETLFITSWGEIMVNYYQGSSGLLDCLGQYLQWQLGSPGYAPPVAEVHAFSSINDDQIISRIGRVFESACEAFYGQHRVSNMRYVLEIEGRFAILHTEESAIKIVQYDSYGDLIAALSQSQAEYSPVTIEAGARRCNVLAAMYKHSRRGVIQLYFYLQPNGLQIYVLDERASLFYHEMAQGDPKQVLGHYYWFMVACLRRKNQSYQDTMWMENDIECYQLIAKPGQDALVERKRLTPQQDSLFFSVQVIGDSFDKSQGFSVFCDQHEFSSLEYGDRLLREVVQYVVQQRRSGMYYPIHITDIDVSPKMLGAESVQQVQTIHYLNYKRKIEGRLNQVLSESTP